MNGKSWWESKTLWINGLTLALAILVAATSVMSPEGEPVIPANVMPYVMMAIAIVNVVLRFLTNAPLQSLQILLPLAGLLLATPAFAEPVGIILDDPKPGNYLVTIDAAGGVTISPLRVVRPGP